LFGSQRLGHRAELSQARFHALSFCAMLTLHAGSCRCWTCRQTISPLTRPSTFLSRCIRSLMSSGCCCRSSSICGNAEDLGHALCRLPSLRHVDLTNDEMSLADCCLIFALMLSSQAPVTTLLLPFNLFSEFPALLSRNRISRDGQHTSTCWCDCNSHRAGSMLLDQRPLRFNSLFAGGNFIPSSCAFLSAVASQHGQSIQQLGTTPASHPHHAEADRLCSGVHALPPSASAERSCPCASKARPRPFTVAPYLSYRQRSRICASSGLTGVLSLRLTIPPRFRPSHQRDMAGYIRGRVGGLLMLAFLRRKTFMLPNLWMG